MNTSLKLDRRQMLASSLATAGVTLTPLSFLNADEPPNSPRKIAAFIKFIQSLSYDELAETIAEAGFQGIEATIRGKGYIEPERAEDELPKLVDALKKHELEITVMATDINRADDPLAEKVLRAAAKLGVKRYRMKHYKYDLKRPILSQLDALKPVVKDLAALNRELGISAVYQVHAGAHNVGCSTWDIMRLFSGYDPAELAIAFDIRHATVEGGTAWPLNFKLAEERLGIVYVKDFTWQGRRPQNVPLGKGQVDPKFFKQLSTSQYTGPISLHVEYLHHAGIEANIAGLKSDLKTLQQLMS